MSVVNLTPRFNRASIFTERLPLKSSQTAYTGMIYHFRHGSMETSYLDLPGHIAETDDGRHAGNIDLREFFRREAALIRLTPREGEYAVSAAELEQAMQGRTWREWMVINALGVCDDGYAPERRVSLSMEAVDLIIRKGVKVLFSDVWESRRLEGVFLRLFDSGVSTVCNLSGLHELPADREFRITVSFLPYPGEVTQIPVSVLAEI